MEHDGRPIESPEQGRGYPESRFNLLLVALAVILIVIGIAQSTGTRAVEPSAVSETVLQGDIAARIAYAYASYLGPMAQAQALELADMAYASFEKEARVSPSPEVLRRLIILSPELVRRDRARYIDELANLKATPPLRGQIAREAAMWRAIYVDATVSRAQAPGFSGRIRDLRLGWYEHLALNRLYESAGMSTQAHEQRARARSAALQSLVLFGLLVFAVLVLGLLGIGLLAWYAGRKNKGAGSADLPSASGDPVVRSEVAGYLLEAFVAYMLAVVAVQLLGGLALSAADVEIGTMGEVIITVGAYVLSGLIALVVLGERLRRGGWGWVDIGLRSRRPFLDVLSGICAYAAALPLVLVTALIAQWVARYLPSPDNPIVPLFVESGSWVARLALFLLAVVAAPFFEELFFRGVLYGSMRAKWGVAAGVILSGVVFGLVHPLPIGLLPILVLGAAFAVVFHERGSLLPGMVAHACNNAVAFALLFILAG